ncbi:MAG TPA: hypothetical protein VM889_08200 [Candidatus Thermoplasmatota archaeon]|nr:hypothetical protein [Candidatus Thermoplasmatota archaeon]
MERTSEFERRAFAAAGPVFFIGFGVLVLVVMAFTALFALVPGEATFAFMVVGGASLALGLLWAGMQRRRAQRG